MHGLRPEYQRPRIADYGGLRRITAAFNPVLGHLGAHDLSFSTEATDPPLAGGATGQDPTSARGEVASGSAGGGTGGGAAGGGAGGGGGHGGGGGNLPFTGLALGAVAAVGSGLTAAGAALRRALRRRRTP